MKSLNKKITFFCIVILILAIQVTGVFAGTGTYYSTLKFGSVGSEVKNLQQALNSRGYSVGTIDGIYGKMTEKAVINFQISEKLTIDGIAGNQTQSTLYNQAAVTTLAVSTTTEKSEAFKLYETNLYWMSRIINAEAEAEPYEGKVAVGSVVMNRLNSSLFPNSVKGVVFDDYNGIPQFSPVSDGTIYNAPSFESVQAAEAALNGAKPVGNATYFFNPDKSAATWIIQNKEYVTRIGNHVFYQ